MLTKQKSQAGFAVAEIAIVVAVFLFVGLIAWKIAGPKHPANVLDAKGSSQQAQQAQEQAAKESAENQSAQNYAVNVFDALNTGDEKRLEGYLSTNYEAYRQRSLTTGECAKIAVFDPLVMFCGSAINPANLESLTPIFADKTVDGTSIKYLTYISSATGGKAGGIYASLQLEGNSKDGWTVVDYNDQFVPTGDKVSTPLAGKLD